MKLSKFKQLYPGAWSNHTQFTLAAFALALLSAASVLLPTQPVQAQSATALEEIVVTARKREESLQEIPVVVNVLTPDMIEVNRIEGIEDLGSIIPGLVTGATSSSSPGSIYLRGVGTGAGNPLFDQAVAINIDGVGISSPHLMNAGMFDLERIEVLRGPQALFYGKNSPGGVIALHTKDPSDEFEFEVSAIYETEGQEPGIRAIVSAPFTETLGGRLSIGWSDADNHLYDVINFDRFEPGPGGVPVQTAAATGRNPVSTESIFAVGTLLWEPSDDFSAKLKYVYAEDTRDGSSTYLTQRTQCGNGPSAPLVIYPVPGIDNCSAGGNVIAPGLLPALVARDSLFPDYNGDNGGFFDEEVGFAVLEINYDLGDDLSFTSVTGYFENKNDRLGDSSWQVAGGLVSSGFSDIDQLSQEFRLNSNYDGAVNFTLGAYYENKEINRGQGVVFGSHLNGLPVAVFGNFGIAAGLQTTSQDSEAYSVFGQVDWELADQWTLTAGARYSYEEKEALVTAEAQATPEIGRPALPLTEFLLLDDKPDWDNISPEVTLSYQLSEDVMFFASYKTGFKSGGIDGSYSISTVLPLTAAGTPYDNIYHEEEVEGFEVGMKSTLLDGTLRLNVTAYSYEYDDMQLSKLTTGPGGVPTLQVINAAAASLDGVELETLWQTPVEGLTLTANVALANSEYDDYIADCFVGQTIAMGCDQNLNTTTGQFTGSDLSGESLQNAPDTSATFAMNYEVVMVGGWNLGLNLSSSYQSNYNATALAFPKEYNQNSYWWTNAAVSLSSSDDKWEFFVRGINLGEERYSTTGSSTIPGGDATTTGTNTTGGLSDFFQYVVGGRQFMLGMTYRL